MARTRTLKKPQPREPGPLGFWQEQTRRLTIRWLIVSYALISLAFWVTAVVAAAWLRHLGLGAVVWIGSAIWLYFALPTLYVHAQFVLDVCGYAITQRTYFFPILQALANTQGPDRGADSLSPRARALYVRLLPYFRAASFTSPFVGPATWALIVLARLPSEAHVQRTTALFEMRRAINIGRRIELTVSEGYAGRQLAHVA